MPKQGQTVAQVNKKIRTDALREQLSSQKHVEHVIDSIKKIECLDNEIEAPNINRLKIGIDSRLKLINKYLPDLKAIELSGELDIDIEVKDHAAAARAKLDAGLAGSDASDTTAEDS